MLSSFICNNKYNNTSSIPPNTATTVTVIDGEDNNVIAHCWCKHRSLTLKLSQTLIRFHADLYTCPDGSTGRRLMAMEVMTRLEELNIVSIIYAVTLFLQINVFLLTICFTHDDRHHYHVVIYIRPHPFIHLSPSDRPIIVSVSEYQ